MPGMKNVLNTVLDPTRRSSDARDFDNTLRRKIVGQDAALEKVVEIYQMFLAGLNPPGRPVGNLLFLGPTGSGKTRVVEAMSETLFGDARACIKIDCAEFQHSHEIAKLIGSPPDTWVTARLIRSSPRKRSTSGTRRSSSCRSCCSTKSRKPPMRSGSCCWAFWTRQP